MGGDRSPASGADRPLRVVRLAPVLDYGGVESKVLLQARLMDRAAIDYRVCTFWKDGFVANEIRKSGIPVDVLGVDPSIRNRAAALVLAGYLDRLGANVVHASIAEANFHLAFATLRLPRRVMIAEEVGVPARRLLARLALAAAYRRMDCVIAVSDATRDYLIEHEFVAARRIRVIHDAISEDYFAPIPERTRGAIRKIVSVGRLVDVKNHETLLRAFSRIARDFPDAELQIVGDGPSRERLEVLARELAIGSRVVFHGFRADVRAALDDADAFALPSISEGFGIALVEAMARGLPVIASNVGSIPSIMAALGSEWLIAPCDVGAWQRGLCELLTLPDKARRRLGTRARELAERYSPGENIARVAQLYAELYARRFRPSRRSPWKRALPGVGA
jgi:glycosyltransferase involved in cell wall biosynthesis